MNGDSRDFSLNPSITDYRNQDSFAVMTRTLDGQRPAAPDTGSWKEGSQAPEPSRAERKVRQVGILQDLQQSTVLHLAKRLADCGKTRSMGRPGIYPRQKVNEINAGFTGCGKLVRAVGRGFIPGAKAMESARASAPEVCFSGISPATRSFSATCLAPGVCSSCFCSNGFLSQPAPAPAS